MPTWLLFVILFVVILIIVWILLSGNPVIEEEEEEVVHAEVVEEAVPVQETITAAAPVEEEPDDLDEIMSPVEEIMKPDDLKKIEGIGPKISGLLIDKGIKTFGQLAEKSTEEIQAILDEANIRIANPATWAEQAKLAADGKWDSLGKLQDELKGGRRGE